MGESVGQAVMGSKRMVRPRLLASSFTRRDPERAMRRMLKQHRRPSGPRLGSLRAAGLGALADLGFRGLDNDVLDPVIVTGFHASRTHKLTPGEKTANRVLAVGRAPIEHDTALCEDPRNPEHSCAVALLFRNLYCSDRRRK
ncbi:hypothetical protein ACFC08_36290 [Streptomyces sp. NPDC056112]|uniref:hypothetical protein n=1 Tax=Streptomyces sp. NPDC056112 TaxID=3345715 RepID=UPI0035D84FC5